MFYNTKYKPRKLINYAKVQGGYAFKSSAYQNDGIPIVRIGDLKDNAIDIKNCTKVKHDYLNSCKNYILRNEDILIAMTGATVGKIAYIKNIEQPMLLNQRVGRFICNEHILPRYLYYVALSNVFLNKVQREATGAGQPNISPNQIENIQIPVPRTIAEQKEIVKVLDAASDMVRLRQECINYTNVLTPAIFQEMFGDVENNKNNYPVLSIKNVAQINPAKNILVDEQKVSFLGMKDVSEHGLIDLSTVKLYKEVKKGFTNFQDNDVLLAKITPCFENGKAAIARNLTNGIGFGSTEFYVLRPDESKILPEYLYSIVKTVRFSGLGKKNMKGAAGQKRLVKDFVLNYKFPIASLDLQEQFAQKALEIEEYKKEQYAELEKAKELFQSLLHHAFTGELTSHKNFGEAE